MDPWIPGNAGPIPLLDKSTGNAKAIGKFMGPDTRNIQEDDPHQSDFYKTLALVASGDNVLEALESVRQSIMNQPGFFDPKILIEYDTIGFILPSIDPSFERRIISNAMTLSIRVLKYYDGSVPPGSGFENPLLAQNIVAIIHSHSDFDIRRDAMRLLIHLLKSDTLGACFFENLMSSDFIGALAASHILEDFDFSVLPDRKADVRGNKMGLIAKTFHALASLTPYMDAEHLGMFETLIPALIHWLEFVPEDAKLRETYAGKLSQIKARDVQLISSILRNDGNRRAAIEMNLPGILMNLIWKNPRGDITAYLFDCVTELCAPGAFPEGFPNLVLLVGTLQSLTRDSDKIEIKIKKHIMRTVTVLCQFISQALWEEDVISEVMRIFKRGTFIQKVYCVEPLIEFGKVCPAECCVEMTQKGFLEDLCNLTPQLEEDMQIRVLEMINIWVDVLPSVMTDDFVSCSYIAELEELCESETEEIAELAQSICGKYQACVNWYKDL